MQIILSFFRRLATPLSVFAGFCLLCVMVYSRLEGLRWLDALFWITHPHSIDYGKVRDATKVFAMFVYVGVFAFQIWVAERVLATIFRRQGLAGDPWRRQASRCAAKRRH